MKKERTIKIFLASSIEEFKNERQELMAFFGSVNNKLRKSGIYIELEKCEDMSSAVPLKRKQDDYNEYIKNSDYLIMLIGRDVGKYTLEEFDVALEHFLKYRTPTILPYFKKVPEGEQVQKRVLDFEKRLVKQLGHYVHDPYSHLSEIENDVLLTIFEGLGVQDGQLLLNEQQVMSLEDVPFYKGNKALQQKIEQKKRLEEEYIAVIRKLSKTPSSKDLLGKKEELERERGTLQRAIDQMETDMLQEHREMLQKRQLGIRLNWREKEARDFVCNDGDYESAKNLLRDAQWEEEVSLSGKKMELCTEEQREQQLVEIRRYIFGKKTLISYIKATGLTPESVDEIKAIYENLAEKAVAYQTEQKVLQEYAEFLMKQNCLEEGIAVAEKLRQYYKNDEKTRNKDKAELLLRLSDLYYEVVKLKESQQCLSEALEIIPIIANDLEREGLRALANRKMGRDLWEIEGPDKAQKWIREALDISTSLSNQNPQDGTLRWILGNVMGIYATLMNKIGEEKEAEKSYEKSIKVYEDLAKNYSDSSWCSLFPDRENMACSLQSVCRNYAIFLNRMNRREEAEKVSRKALEVGRSIAARNPQANEAQMALLCSFIAGISCAEKRYKEAESLYREARPLYKSLTVINPRRYGDAAIINTTKMAKLLEQKKRESYVSPLDDSYEGEEALELYREAQSLYDEENYIGRRPYFNFVNAKVQLGTAAEMSRAASRFVPKRDSGYVKRKMGDKWVEYAGSEAERILGRRWEHRGLLRLVKEGKIISVEEWLKSKPPEELGIETRDMSWEEWLESKRYPYKIIETFIQTALNNFQSMKKSENYAWNILVCYEEWGTVLWKLMNRVEEADEMYKEACEMAVQYENDNTYRMRVSGIYLKRAMTLAAMNRMEESKEYMLKSRKCEECYKKSETEGKAGGKPR